MDQAELTSDPFEVFLREIHAKGPLAPERGGFYSPAGDSVFVYTDSTPHYAEYVDTLLTVYRALEDNAIVGFQLKNIARLGIHAVTANFSCPMGGPRADAIYLLLLSYEQQLAKRIQKQEADWEKARQAYADAFRSIQNTPTEIRGLLAAA